ncbi:hypothetical protein EVAR_68778_1 [Eumeta japonica]|uniref:Uncharacterized protein n=1 Tax=Eumeta variegata TaxID=151549 RepID=A0A4C1Z655_EUMVA|nr:hypothetical protein EVAR_68778_1 [Eumeta japonica]
MSPRAGFVLFVAESPAQLAYEELCLIAPWSNVESLRKKKSPAQEHIHYRAEASSRTLTEARTEPQTVWLKTEI